MGIEQKTCVFVQYHNSMNMRKVRGPDHQEAEYNRPFRASNSR